jgi:pyruvate dehydrogenase E1 component alpha subunit
MTLQNISTEKELDDIDDQVQTEVQSAVEFAENSPAPALNQLYTDVYVAGYPD